jgi:hypothetical protein
LDAIRRVFLNPCFSERNRDAAGPGELASRARIAYRKRAVSSVVDGCRKAPFRRASLETSCERDLRGPPLSRAAILQLASPSSARRVGDETTLIPQSRR